MLATAEAPDEIMISRCSSCMAMARWVYRYLRRASAADLDLGKINRQDLMANDTYVTR